MLTSVFAYDWETPHFIMTFAMIIFKLLFMQQNSKQNKNRSKNCERRGRILSCVPVVVFRGATKSRPFGQTYTVYLPAKTLGNLVSILCTRKPGRPTLGEALKSSPTYKACLIKYMQWYAKN